MAVKVVTESLGDIPHEVAEELGITVIPITVLFGAQSFRDGVDLTTEQFYYKLMQGKTFPTTVVPPLSVFVEVYDKLAEETDEILTIAISHKLSASYDAALEAKKLMKKKCRVEVIDSLWAAMGHGLIVIAAARAAKAGASLDEVVALTQKNIPRADIRMAFDTLEYLSRGGRIGKAQAFLGSALKVNPILGLRDGEVAPFARERSRAKAIDYLYDFASGFSHIEAMAVEDATTPDEADKLVERLGSLFPKKRIYRSKVSPAIGVHVGPRVLGVAVLGDKG
ncbi:MAG: DegV family protein [Dehalococcoidia bacterium]|nr:DegV family protein [Dehalococcoidia bacterium]